MEKKINIPYYFDELKEDGIIPVLYHIFQENENVIQIHCRIDLLEDKKPKWLALSNFVIRQVYQPGNPGVYITELSSIPCKTSQEAFLVDAVHERISFNGKINIKNNGI